VWGNELNLRGREGEDRGGATSFKEFAVTRLRGRSLPEEEIKRTAQMRPHRGSMRAKGKDWGQCHKIR